MPICCLALEMIFFQSSIKKSVKKNIFMGIEELLLHFCIKSEKRMLIVSEIAEKCSFGQEESKNEFMP